MEHLLVATNAVAPFLVYLSLGALVRWLGWADADLLGRLNALSFKAFFPFMMFCSIYRIEGDFVINWIFVGVSLVSTLVVVGLSMLVVPRLVPGNAQRGVLVQALYRTNLVFFAFPLATSVFGDAALVPAATMIAFVVTAYNVLAVLVLTYFDEGRRRGVKARVVILDMVRNPIIEGLIVGLVFHFLGIRLPGALESPVLALGNLATPIALIVLGGTLSLGETRENLRILAPTLVVKLLVLPALALAVAVAFPMSGAERFLVVMMFAAPVATASFPMAESMGGDGRLAGQLVVLSTVVSVVTIFGWVTLLSGMLL